MMPFTLRLKLMSQLLQWTLLVFIAILPHLCNVSSEDVNIDCVVDGNSSFLNISYSGPSVDTGFWQFTHTSGQVSKEAFEPCHNEWNISFICRGTNDSRMFQMVLIISDFWSEMMFGFYVSDEDPKQLRKYRNECLVLTNPTIVTTTSTVTIDTFPIADGDRTDRNHLGIIAGVVIPIWVITCSLGIYICWKKKCFRLLKQPLTWIVILCCYLLFGWIIMYKLYKKAANKASKSQNKLEVDHATDGAGAQFLKEWKTDVAGHNEEDNQPIPGSGIVPEKQRLVQQQLKNSDTDDDSSTQPKYEMESGSNQSNLSDGSIKLTPTSSCGDLAEMDDSSDEEPEDVEFTIQMVHRKLLNTILDALMPFDSPECEKFLQGSKVYPFLKDAITKCRETQNLFKIFDALETADKLKADKYEVLKKIAECCQNETLLNHVTIAEQCIRNLRAQQETDQKHKVVSKLLIEAVQKAQNARQKFDVDLIGKIKVQSQYEDISKLGSTIIYEVIVAALKNIDMSKNEHDLAALEASVANILSDINTNGNRVRKVDMKCIVITVQCTTLAGLISLLDYTDSELLKQCLGAVSAALCKHLGTSIQTTFCITNRSLSKIWQELVLQNDLINHFRKTCSKLQISPIFYASECVSNLLELHVPPMFAELQSEMKQEDVPCLSDYIPPTLVCFEPVNNKIGKESKSVSLKSYHDVFVKNFQACRHIYISSPAGRGKTSFVKRMVLTWCQAHQPIESDNQWFMQEDIDEMRQFKYLFLIYLGESPEGECYIDTLIQKQLLSDLEHSCAYSTLGFLQKLLSTERCLVIMDGLDQWSHPQNSQCNMTNAYIPHSRAWPLCTVLTTTRPWKLEVAALKPDEIDQKLSLSVLKDDLLDKLIVNVMSKMHKKEIHVQEFKNELNAKKLTSLIKIPVVVMQLLILWCDDKPLGESQCEIYSNVIEFFLERYYFKKIMVVASTDSQAPVCFKDNIHCKVHMNLLTKLGQLAFYALFSDSRESSLTFHKNFAKKYLNDTEFEMSWEAGILTHEEVTSNTLERKSYVCFIHKTFQEFLAALYVARSPNKCEDINARILKICCSSEEILQMSQLFVFLSGLCPQVMSHLCERLRKVVVSEDKRQIYRSTCELQPWSYPLRTLRKIQDTMIDCSRESRLNHHKNICLPLSDIFISDGSYGSQWSTDFMSLVANNSPLSLSVRWEDSSKNLNEILNSVNLVNFIQKLWIGPGVPSNFVVSLLSQYTPSSNVKSKTWAHLECLTLCRIKDLVSCDSLCSLVDFILQLPMSVKVRLEHCHISQGTGDWINYIQSHPQLTIDNSEPGVCADYVSVLQFHTFI